MKMSLSCAVLALLLPVAVSAQTVINPTSVEFPPSTDHSALRLDGSSVVTSYEFNAVAPNPAGAIALTVGLGKPAPNAAGLIVVPVAQLSTLTANAIYTATVTAKGPDGNRVSVASNPFGRATPVVPAPPGKPIVK